jgi:hypothetical protein
MIDKELNSKRREYSQKKDANQKMEDLLPIGS